MAADLKQSLTVLWIVVYDSFAYFYQKEKI